MRFGWRFGPAIIGWWGLRLLCWEGRYWLQPTCWRGRWPVQGSCLWGRLWRWWGRPSLSRCCGGGGGGLLEGAGAAVWLSDYFFGRDFDAVAAGALGAVQGGVCFGDQFFCQLAVV